ncbi:hypothetical protein VaNZ11_012976, partial [Volvox africanus]
SLSAVCWEVVPLAKSLKFPTLERNASPLLHLVRYTPGMWRGRRVAVKVVTTSSAEEYDKVQHEVEVTSQLAQHPNIVTTFTSARVGPASRTASLVPERPDLHHKHGAAATISATAAAAATVA